MNDQSIPALAQQASFWLGILLSLVGAGVAIAYLQRSKWTRLLLCAFLFQVLLQLATRFLVPVLLRNAATTMNATHFLNTIVVLLALLGFLTHAALVLGIAGVLSELARLRQSS